MEERPEQTVHYPGSCSSTEFLSWQDVAAPPEFFAQDVEHEQEEYSKEHPPISPQGNIHEAGVREAGGDPGIEVGKRGRGSEERDTGNPTLSKGQGQVAESRHEEPSHDPLPGFATQRVQPQPLLHGFPRKVEAFQPVRHEGGQE